MFHKIILGETERCHIVHETVICFVFYHLKASTCRQVIEEVCIKLQVRRLLLFEMLLQQNQLRIFNSYILNTGCTVSWHLQMISDLKKYHNRFSNAVSNDEVQQEVVLNMVSNSSINADRHEKYCLKYCYKYFHFNVFYLTSTST